jgi:hypothetical protein
VILATAMPSLSFAAAANPVDSMKTGNNINMMPLQNGWPENLNREKRYRNDWQHSDFWKIDATHVKRMYEKMIENGSLKQ